MDHIPIPNNFPYAVDYHTFWPEDAVEQFTEKELWNNRGMYAFVSWEWINPLAHWIGQRKVLEVMAGAGWLARALREKGIDIIATDDYSWIDKRGWTMQTEVERIKADEAVAKYGSERDILIISWPYMDADGYEAIKKWHDQKPDRYIIYLGEDEGGCTANEQFFEHFEEIFTRRFSQISSLYKTWFGLHDRLVLGRFKQ